jgi:hypothetical protein
MGCIRTLPSKENLVMTIFLAGSLASLILHVPIQGTSVSRLSYKALEAPHRPVHFLKGKKPMTRRVYLGHMGVMAALAQAVLLTHPQEPDLPNTFGGDHNPPIPPKIRETDFASEARIQKERKPFHDPHSARGKNLKHQMRGNRGRGR